MSNKLNFDALVNEASEDDSRWKSREPNPVVQMSLRMHENTYKVFRKLCKKERRTNGDMLEVLLKFYIENQPKEQTTRKG